MIPTDKATPTITMDTVSSQVNTLIPNKEAESKEYTTLVHCTAKLIIALCSDDSIVHFLNQEGFIKHQIYNRINNPISFAF